MSSKQNMINWYEHRGREEDAEKIVKMFFPDFTSTIKTQADLIGIDGYIGEQAIDIKAVESPVINLTVLRSSNGRNWRLPHYLTENIDIIIVWFSRNFVLRLDRKKIFKWLSDEGSIKLYRDKNGVYNLIKPLNNISDYIIGAWSEEGLEKCTMILEE